METLQIKQALIPLLEKMQKEAMPSIVVEVKNESYLLDPATKTYTRLDPRFGPSRNRTISNAEALLQVVVEEARRRENKTGDQMTVIFNESGAVFYPDDKNRDNPDSWVLNRKKSKHYIALLEVVGKKFDHAGLLRAMTSLRNIVQGYQSVYLAMRKVRLSKGLEVMSTPRVIDGESGAQVNVSFKIEGQEKGQNVAFPAEFQVKLPIISMSSSEYVIDVEVDSFVSDKELVFVLQAPGTASTMTKAVLDEIEVFTTDAKTKLPELLIVTDL